jgi:hypothetical protein
VADSLVCCSIDGIYFQEFKFLRVAYALHIALFPVIWFVQHQLYENIPQHIASSHLQTSRLFLVVSKPFVVVLRFTRILPISGMLFFWKCSGGCLWKIFGDGVSYGTRHTSISGDKQSVYQFPDALPGCI